MKKQWIQNGMLILICLFTVLILAEPGLAREKVTVIGDKMRHFVPEDQILITGNAQIATSDLLIRADRIEAEYRDGKVLEIKATGHVKMEKDGEVFEGKELTYHLEDKTGLILDMRGTSSLEDTEELAYLKGEKAYYSEDMVEIVNGSMTTCDLDHPHYLFRAKRVIVYPEDKIRAYHLTFWEFNGKVPLFYWYRYTISLKDEEQHFTPKIGYNGVTGWFLKMTYSYFTDGEQHGEFYLDLFQRVGPAAGVKWWYMDQEKNEGSVYLYLQQQTESKTYPFLTFRHNQRYYWEDVDLNSNSSLKLYGNRDQYSSTNNLTFKGEGINNIRWSSSYSGSANYAADTGELSTGSQSLSNTLTGKLKLSDITFEAKYNDRVAYAYRNQEWSSSDKNPWTGKLTAAQNTPFVDWKLEANKENKSSTTPWLLYTLPELTTKLKLTSVKGKLRPYLSPISYEMKIGHFHEEYLEEVTAYRWYNKLSASKTLQLPGPFSLAASTSGMARVYSTKDVVYEYGPTLDLKMRSVKGVSTNLKYNYNKAIEGVSPFRFDRLASKETMKLTGSVNYNQSGLMMRSNTSYDLFAKKFGVLSNSLTYRWGEGKEQNNLRLVVPYRIEERKLSTMTATMKLNYEDLQFGFGSSYNPDTKKIGKLDSELSWQVLENWHVNLVVSYDPNTTATTGDAKKGKLEKGTLEITRDLHCRELSLSYNAIERELWLQYHITAFPKQKFKFGSSEDDPMLFDADLGGILDGTE